MKTKIFENLFVLEITNNHLGDVNRGIRIIESHSKVVHKHKITAAMKLQFRDIDLFIHKDHIRNNNNPYISRVKSTRLTKKELKILVNSIIDNGCLPIATPFDEQSVDLCDEFNLPIVKIASADSNDWFLIERIAASNKPVIASVGGLDIHEIDNLVSFFESKKIPLAINHCVATYPTNDNDLELNQIDLLVNRYPANTIGFSSHEFGDWASSLLIAYAKGARIFERHIDINFDGAIISPYSSLPNQIDTWFSNFNKAKEMCGSETLKRVFGSSKEQEYISSHVRGIYAKRDIAIGETLSIENIYLAIPPQKGQLTTRTFNNSILYKVSKQYRQDEPILLDDLHSSDKTAIYENKPSD